MTVKSIEIQFVQCDCCGQHAPVVADSDRGTWADGALAQDAAREQGWRVNGDGLDLCDRCVESGAKLGTKDTAETTKKP